MTSRTQLAACAALAAASFFDGVDAFSLPPSALSPALAGPSALHLRSSPVSNFARARPAGHRARAPPRRQSVRIICTNIFCSTLCYSSLHIRCASHASRLLCRADHAWFGPRRFLHCKWLTRAAWPRLPWLGRARPSVPLLLS
jgi:hypothetical protein